ncbi:arsenate reductase/protein-tyrosine-phosphatase family protein [Actinacidiphila bryophytorum]|uniref:arsenate reductase/protein-tyrosine-phosphatase family protein n=1 Tax=Actinacidiphila bryophytorum TaxID=1436133 RepID=UPI002176E231|nr:low molecular weight phosphotyrosine protein phosphatase [Actinacidiphila bryophytorum]UWE07612.1 low molecular weight phosphotyrosine protein phosphatase [Actinacidiphila bryophytorum]
MSANGQAVRPRRILTVCKGGHCRAPFAAAVLAHRGGGAVETRAAAVERWHVGEGAHPNMIEIADRLGYDLTGHRGVQVGPDLLEWADVVLAMDTTVLESLRRLADTRNLQKLRLYLDGRDVPDPWKQAVAAFTACVATIESGAQAHLPTGQHHRSRSTSGS